MSTYSAADALKYLRILVGREVDSAVERLYDELQVDAHPELERLWDLGKRIAAVIDPLDLDWDRYSDGRRVQSSAEIEQGHTFVHLWQPDPDSESERRFTGDLLADPGQSKGTYEATIVPPQTVTIRKFPRALEVVKP